MALRVQIIQKLSTIVPENYKLQEPEEFPGRGVTYVIKGFDRNIANSLVEKIDQIQLDDVDLKAEWCKIGGIGNILEISWISLEDYKTRKMELEKKLAKVDERMVRF